MNNEIVKAGTNQVALPCEVEVTEKSVREFLFTSKTKLSSEQQNMFIQVAVRNKLDPFKREVYAVAYGNEFNIITGYQTYIARAEESGKLNGWSCELSSDGKQAKVTIHRKDQAHPFVWTVERAEFDGKRALWLKCPGFMLKKVAIGQAFRLAFPAELGGMPYTSEEVSTFSKAEETPVEARVIHATPATPPKATEPVRDDAPEPTPPDDIPPEQAQEEQAAKQATVDVPGITEKQLSKLTILMREVEMTDEEGKDWIASEAAYAIKDGKVSRRFLTKSDASRLIDKLTKCKATNTKPF